MAAMREAVIVSAARTPIGSFGGALKEIPATRLGSIAVKATLERSGVAADRIDEVIMGNVLPANEGQAPARQAALGAGLPKSTQCLTINKVCGSGLKAVMLAAQAVQVGDAEIIIAGGMENMNQVPYYLEKARFGYKMGNASVIDGMIKDGLWDVYNDFHMGMAAERCADECHISREDQDKFSLLSYQRAQNAIQEGLFKDEIVAVEIPQRKGDPVIFDTDEEPGKANFEKIPKLRPAFKKEGTVTAANASSINDGAAAVMVMSADMARELKLTPLAIIVAQASAAREPHEFTMAPSDAIRKVLDKAGMQTDEIDLFEINEAFAVVSLINNKLLGLPVEKVNVNGGAVALGHPIGASGARILVTLLYNMKRQKAKYGIASLCIGGGEASALLVKNT